MSDTGGRSSEARAAAAAAIGSICVGFTPLFVSGLQTSGMETVSILFWRYIIALLILVPLAIRYTEGLGQEWQRGGRWLYLNGITLGALQTYFYFKAVETLATSVVVTVFYCYPIFAMLLDRWLFMIEIRATTVLALGVVLIGVVLTSLPGLMGASLDTLGLVLAVGSAIGYAIYIAIAYPATRRVAPLASATFIYASMATAFGIVAFSRGLSVPATPGLWLSLVFVGTLGGALSIASFAYALPRLSSSGYALIVCLELVTVVLLGVVLLGERLEPVQGLGIALVLGGILFERLMRARRMVGKEGTG